MKLIIVFVNSKRNLRMFDGNSKKICMFDNMFRYFGRKNYIF